jgi:hypothetical protein
MGDDDLIVAAPWLLFAVGLAAIGWRLAVGRRRRGTPGAERADSVPAADPGPADAHGPAQQAPRVPGA